MWYLLVVCLLTVGVALPNVNAATLYTSPGGSPSSNCTQASPCSIARSLVLLAGGDTLMMHGGAYNSGFGSPFNVNVPSGTSGAYTRIQAVDVNNPPIILSVTMPERGAGQELSYIIFDGITVDGYQGFGMGGGHHIEFINGVSRNANLPTGFALNITGGKHHIRIANSRIHNAQLYGFYVSWHDSTIENNLIYDNNSYGLHFFCGQYNDGTVPCAVEGGDPFVGHIANNIIRNNKLWGNGYCNKWPTCLTTSGVAMVVSGGPENFATNTSFNNQIYNNIVYDNFGGGIQIYPGLKDTLVYNNTVFRNVGPGIILDAGGAGCCNNGPLRPVVKNNILYQNTTPINDQGAVSADITHNFPTDPAFVNQGGSDFHLQPGSGAKNAGSPALYPPTDYDGIPQNQGGAPSAGAYEFPEGGPTPPGVAVSAAPSSVVVGGNVTATWSNIASPTGSDSIKLYTPAAGDGSPLASVNTGGAANGSVILTIPGSTAPGTYNLRLFNGAGTSTKLATSNNFTVTSGGNPPTAASVHVAQTGGDDSRDCPTGENPVTPLLTITKACTCMTIPGKHMVIHTGIYVEKFDTSTCPVTGGNGPSFEDATVIETFSTDNVTIKLPSSGVGLFLRNGVSDKYIIIKGSPGHKLVLDADNKPNSNVIGLTNGAHHIWFQQVEIKNTSGGFEAVYASNTNNIVFSDSLIHHAGLAGIGLSSGALNWFIERTVISNNGAAGIRQYDGTVTAMAIRESIIHTNAAEGVFLGASTGFNIYNSIIHGNSGKGIHINTGASGPMIHNNTIYGNVGAGVQCDAGATGAEIKNSLVYNNTGANIVNNCSLILSSNLPDGMDPIFVNASIGDFHLQSTSPAINAGETLPNVTKDFEGNSRPRKLQYDIGAYESDFNSPFPPVGPDVTVRALHVQDTGMFF